MLLEIRDLVTTARGVGDRSEVALVDGVSLRVEAGRTLALVGESGSGKSVTALSVVRLLSAGVRIAGGSILFEGRELIGAPEAHLRALRGNRIAMIFQDPMSSLNPVLSIAAQLCEPLMLHRRMSRGAAMNEARELLRAVGIPAAAERLHDFPHELSGGMRQRVMIAMALACRPALLIADEPTTALDVTVQAQILALLRDLQRRFGMGILFITHDLAVVSETADQVAVMYAGRIVETGSAARVLAAPRHPYTQALLRCAPRVEEPAGGDAADGAPGGADRGLRAGAVGVAGVGIDRGASAAGGTDVCSQAAQRLLPVIAGEPPSPLRRPTGCAFHPRCDRPLLDRCRSEVPPPVVSKADGGLSACWLAEG
ncbi:MAG: ABC transporter ATP-binding protein [Phycisphaerales bacterium]|nr:ABC transporter ATP-binding protein [Phycisphaerales bacterium]